MLLGAPGKALLERIEENSNSDYESSHAYSVRKRTVNEGATPGGGNTSEVLEEPFALTSEAREGSKPKSFVERSMT